MNQKSKIAYSQWAWLVFSWIFITVYFSWLINTNLHLFFDLSNSWHIVESNIMFSYMYSGLQYLESILFGIFFGSAFFLINVFTDRNRLSRKSFGKIILIKTVLYVIAIVVSFFFILCIFSLFNLFPNEAPFFDYIRLVGLEYWITIFIFFVFFIILTNILIQIQRKFGPGNFLRLLTGKYYIPSEEEKIFLFIDLKGSTTIAEKLGHKIYSQLLRDCFHDITDIVFQYRAEVYQYVGDEIVLCWDVKTGITDLNCFKLLIEYRKHIESKSGYYKEKYEVVPDFKGGLDVGNVTVTEIGDIKRDIAYHGDVLNTASRIQEQCNKHNRKLLFSEHLHKIIKNFDQFEVELMGQIPLRGKNEKLNIFGIDE